MIKFPESETGNSLPCNVEDDVVELYIHSALYIHGVTNNEANSVWEYSAKEDFLAQGDKVTGNLRRLHEEELHDLYPPNIIRVMT